MNTTSPQTPKASQVWEEEITKRYSNVFKGPGRLKKPYHIEIDPNVTPAINAPRNIPAALLDAVKAELEEMEKANIICKVEEPTDWVSLMVVAGKPNGKLRNCLDPQHLNQAMKRDHYQLPTIEDKTTHMANAKWLPKLDANHGYWQIPLDPESQLLTIFNTPFG